MCDWKLIIRECHMLLNAEVINESSGTEGMVKRPPQPIFSSNIEAGVFFPFMICRRQKGMNDGSVTRQGEINRKDNTT